VKLAEIEPVEKDKLIKVVDEYLLQITYFLMQPTNGGVGIDQMTKSH